MIRIYARASARFARGGFNWPSMSILAHMVAEDYVPQLETHEFMAAVPTIIATIAVRNPAVSDAGWISADPITFPPTILQVRCNQVVISDQASARTLFHIGFAPLPIGPLPRPFSLLHSSGRPGWCRL